MVDLLFACFHFEWYLANYHEVAADITKVGGTAPFYGSRFRFGILVFAYWRFTNSRAQEAKQAIPCCVETSYFDCVIGIAESSGIGNGIMTYLSGCRVFIYFRSLTAA